MSDDTPFSRFTNLYSLSKTLKFELKPIGNTQKMLEDNNVFKKDEIIQIKYQDTKPYFDRLHRDFIEESLNDVKLDGLTEYFDNFKEWKKDKNNQINKNTIKKNKELLRKQVVSFFDRKGKEWATQKYTHLKIKKKDLNILFEEQVFQILKDKYGNEEKTKLINHETGELVSKFDGWKGFTGYFIKLFETRKNFYKSDGTSTAIATRIVDQNLDRFLDNILIYESIKNKISVTEIEEFSNLKADDVFTVNYYSNCLLQDGINQYNEFLGGKTLQNGEKIKGINEIINEYRLANKGEKLPFLKKLDKQILSEKGNYTEEVQTDEELKEILKLFHQSSTTRIKLLKKLLNNFFEDTSKYNLTGIFISKPALNTISHKWTDQTDTFNLNLYEVLKAEKLISGSKNQSEEGYALPDFISLEYLKIALDKIAPEQRFWKDRYFENLDGDAVLHDNKNVWQQFLDIFAFEFYSHFIRNIKNAQAGVEEEDGYEIYDKKIQALFLDFKINKGTKVTIKNFADEVLNIYQMAKYFALEKKRSWVEDLELDNEFYHHLEYGFKENFYENAYEEIVQPYNKIRNYLTKKPYSENKWKLNFENPTLANGWDKNKESDNTAIILTKGNNYYLAIMHKGDNQIFNDKNKADYHIVGETEYYKKMVYKLFPDPAKMMPKVCFSTKGLDFFKPSTEIINIYKNNEFKIGETFSLQSMQKLISFYIDCLGKYDGWKCYSFEYIKKPNEYLKNIGEFYSDVAKSGYKLDFEEISSDYIETNNKSNKLFLFQIYSKDFSSESKGVKNIHTLYFQEVFSEPNRLNNFPLKLNGQAELFFRPKTEISRLGNKKDNNNKEIINHKRYSNDKIFFHIPITFNRYAKGDNRFNTQINNFLANNPDIKIIGVDRGEKHLAYYSVIRQNGEIIESGSLNTINNVDYATKLDERAKNREQARKDWQDVEVIKDLKKGYISQVVRRLADLAIKHNAIIVMEDLNMRFKQIRGGIEKSIYQQLEKALIEKLNYLVDKKEVDPEKAGHLLRAYQLTAPITSFKEMGKQTGIIFYTQASYTSRIDPLTGWRPNLYLKYTNANKAKEDLLKFDSIEYNADKDRFEFRYDITKFQQLKEYPKKTNWTICSNVERYRWNKRLNNNKGGYDYYPNITENLKELLKDYSIETESKDIKQQISEVVESGNEKLFKDLLFYINLICQIRNTQQDKQGDENDFILSPIEPFFDSRKSEINGKNLPRNGDDNGAYNIARKGIIILNKISDFVSKKITAENLILNDLYISHSEWDDFTVKSAIL